MGKINHSINTLKFASIFAIIVIHCINLNDMNQEFSILLGLMRFAVPVFFLISGFYSFYEDKGQANDKYKKRIIRLLKLIIIANLLYFILTPHFHDISNLGQFFNFKSILKYLILNLPLIAGHLWFLDALLYCYLFVIILNKLNININKLYFIIPLLFAANLFLGEISSILHIPVPFYYHRNFIFTGLPFFMVGYLIHDKIDFIENNLSNFIILLSLMPITSLILFESSLSIVELYFGTIIFSVMIFIWNVLNPDMLHFEITNLIGGKLYGYIYILHLYVMFTLLKYYSLDFGYLNPIIVFIITTIISFIVYKAFNYLKANQFS